MNIYFLNRQNKLNLKLNERHEDLSNDNLHWFGLALFQNNEKLNKKVHKLAPRRNKRENARLLKKISKDYAISEFDYLSQAIADLNDDNTFSK